MQMEPCPNRYTCPLISKADYPVETSVREQYKQVYCLAGEAAWKSCRRFQLKEELHLCPDFVLPDSGDSTDEILDKIESGMN